MFIRPNPHCLPLRKSFIEIDDHSRLIPFLILNLTFIFLPKKHKIENARDENVSIGPKLFKVRFCRKA